MATAIGSLIAFTAKRTNYRLLSIATGFSAGVMVYVSFVEIFFKGLESLVEKYGDYHGHWINTASFFGGMLFIGVIDNLIPSAENPHEIHQTSESLPFQDPILARQPCATPMNRSIDEAYPHNRSVHNRKLMRMGIFTALAIGIHNFPEGMATFIAALHDPGLGLAIAIAVGLHNIPEGISVSVPIFYATGNRRKAFVYSVLSGLAEPVGAIIALFAIRLFFASSSAVIQPELMGVLFGAVAGIMVYISLDQLLPTSRAYGKGHDTLYGLVSGMIVMALSLLLME